MNIIGTYEIRAMEIHDSTQIWNLERIERRLNFMVRNHMNAMVFHEPGIEDKIVFPARFLGADGHDNRYYDAFLKIDHQIYQHALRENLNLNRRDYMNHVIRLAREAGVDVYFENKELWFSDFVLKYKKELMKDGVICPSDPFWYEEFLPAKYEELFVALPDLAGIVVSIGTGEARLAISNTFGCSCERCRKLSPVNWYRNMILAMYQPFKKAGKRLVIRDFIYTKAEQERFCQAFLEMPEDIELSLKNTPHDFYPTFPNNPLMGQVGSHPQWTEYDVQGQFYGQGTIPSAMLDDIRRRLDYGRRHGVTAFMARTDWEGVQDWSCFDNLNLLNLYAIASLSENPAARNEEIYLKWLTGEGMLGSEATSAQIRGCLKWIDEVLGQTWNVVEHTNYINGCLFSNDSCMYLTTGQFTFIGGTHHSLKEWNPDAADAMDMTPENIARIVADKDDALARATALNERLEERCPALTDAAWTKLKKHIRFMLLYVRAFRLNARGYCFGRYTELHGADAPLLNSTAGALLKEVVADLKVYQSEMSDWTILKEYPFEAQISPERLEYFTRDLERILKGGQA